MSEKRQDSGIRHGMKHKKSIYHIYMVELSVLYQVHESMNYLTNETKLAISSGYMSTKCN